MCAINLLKYLNSESWRTIFIQIVTIFCSFWVAYYSQKKTLEAIRLNNNKQFKKEQLLIFQTKSEKVLKALFKQRERISNLNIDLECWVVQIDLSWEDRRNHFWDSKEEMWIVFNIYFKDLNQYFKKFNDKTNKFLEYHQSIVRKKIICDKQTLCILYKEFDESFHEFVTAIQENLSKKEKEILL